MRQQETALEQLRRQKLLLQLEYYTEKEAFRKQQADRDHGAAQEGEAR